MGAEAGELVNTRALRHVLLLVQGALGGLVAAETVLLGLFAGSRALLALSVLGVALAALPVVLAFRLLRGRRRARVWAVAYELALLVLGYLNAAVLGNDDVASLMATLLLPAALLVLLGRYSPEASETAG
jgi:hypothetical protein